MYHKKNDSKYVNIQRVNPFYFIFDKVDGFIEEKEGNKYLNLAFTDNNSEVLKKYEEIWNGVKNLIEKIDNKPDDYGKDYMKIKFNLGGDLPVNKPLKFHNLTIIVRSVFEENDKYYPQIFLDEFLYELYKCYNMISLKELILINQINQKNALLAIIVILKKLVMNMNHMFVMNVMIYQ